jgi:hypothetical protein
VAKPGRGSIPACRGREVADPRHPPQPTVDARAGGCESKQRRRRPYLGKGKDGCSRRPGAFYPLFFLITFQIADMFNTCRALAGALLHAVLGTGG